MTRKMILIAGVAGLALTAPALADRGGNGHGGGGGGNPQAQQQPAPQQQRQSQRPERQAQPQQQRAERPQMQRVARPQEMQRPQRAERPQMPRIERQMPRMERPQQMQRVERQTQRIARAQRPERQMQRTERPQRAERPMQRMERPQQIQRAERQMQRPQQVQRDERQMQREQEIQRDERQMRRIDRQAMNEGRSARIEQRDFRPSIPFAANREMRQMKPFKAKFDSRPIATIGQRVQNIQSFAPIPSYFAGNYVDTRDYVYRYNNDLGTVYRIDRNDGIVRSMIPLFGGYNSGSPWPSTYYDSYVPAGFRDYYYDTPDYYYRNDGYGIYQVDGDTQLITALVQLISGQGFGIGQYLPASYDTYNVPLDYRDRYADDSDRWYRYGDGYIYEVNPSNRLISARYPIYADQYAYDIGQPWPSAYPDYNIPYGYRDAYYDTPQAQYRYADDAIYRVNPTDQVIQAVVALLSGDRFAVGQRMPAGYDTYNVPFDYRDRYADNDRDWYRYANGTVYQVDPLTGLIEEAYPV